MTTAFKDKLTMDAKPSFTDEGYMMVTAKIARTGLYDYHASELGLMDDRIIKVYRPADTVFDKKSMQSFARKPVTMDHPPMGVSADNWANVSVGEIDPVGIARDGEYLTVPFMVRDKAAIQQVKDGKAELSAGYTCDLELKDGVTPDGEKYDAIQTGDLQANHLAIVSRGRAGHQCRIGDTWGAAPSQPKEKTMKTTHVVLDGKSVEVLADSEALIKTAIEAKDAQIKKLEDANGVLTGEKAVLEKDLKDAKAIDLDALVADRSAVLDKAKALGVEVADGMSNDDLRKAAVSAALADTIGSDAVEAFNDEAVKAAFDKLEVKADDKKSTLGDKLKDAKRKTDDDNGFDGYADSLHNAWKGK